MGTFEKKDKSPEDARSASPKDKVDRALKPAPPPLFLHLQRTIGNKAVQRLLQQLLRDSAKPQASNLSEPGNTHEVKAKQVGNIARGQAHSISGGRSGLLVSRQPDTTKKDKKPEKYPWIGRIY